MDRQKVGVFRLVTSVTKKAIRTGKAAFPVREGRRGERPHGSPGVAVSAARIPAAGGEYGEIVN